MPCSLVIHPRTAFLPDMSGGSEVTWRQAGGQGRVQGRGNSSCVNVCLSQSSGKASLKPQARAARVVHGVHASLVVQAMHAPLAKWRHAARTCSSVHEAGSARCTLACTATPSPAHLHHGGHQV